MFCDTLTTESLTAVSNLHAAYAGSAILGASVAVRVMKLDIHRIIFFIIYLRINKEVSDLNAKRLFCISDVL